MGVLVDSRPDLTHVVSRSTSLYSVSCRPTTEERMLCFVRGRMGLIRFDALIRLHGRFSDRSSMAPGPPRPYGEAIAWIRCSAVWLGFSGGLGLDTPDDEVGMRVWYGRSASRGEGRGMRVNRR